MTLSLFNPVSELSDQELCIVVAREVLGWEQIRQRSDGEFVGENLRVMTAFPLVVADWANDAGKVASVEAAVKGKVGSVAYRDELGRVAGGLNPHPTPRQKCEAALLAVRRVVREATGS